MIPESRVWRTIRAQTRRAAAWPFRVAAARATLRTLAKMDRRELADIGLNSSDLLGASALPPDRDPGELLARRVLERRSSVSAAPPAWPMDDMTARDPGRPMGDPEKLVRTG